MRRGTIARVRSSRCMSREGDIVRRRVFELTDVIVRQRSLVSDLKYAGRDSAEAECALVAYEAEHAASIEAWRRVRGW